MARGAWMGLVVAGLLGLAGCDDEGEGGAGAVDAATLDGALPGGDRGVTADVGGRLDAAPMRDAAPALDAAATPDVAPPPDAAPTPDGGLTCAGGEGCFSNNECPADQRCANVGTEEEPVTCCVVGARGQLPAGSDCSDGAGERTCASAICIDGLCSTTCGAPEDCPVGMRACMPIAFSGSDDSWCFPER